jgi:rhodanese-related sulfurtransferase
MRPQPDIPAVDVTTAAQRLAGPEPPLLVDVREPDEYATVRAEGAITMPLSTFTQRYGELPRDRALLLICAVGGRSGAATAHLLANGYPNVTNVTGGTLGWERAGLPVRHGTPAPGEGDLPAR